MSGGLFLLPAAEEDLSLSPFGSLLVKTAAEGGGLKDRSAGDEVHAHGDYGQAEQEVQRAQEDEGGVAILHLLTSGMSPLELQHPMIPRRCRRRTAVCVADGGRTCSHPGLITISC